jgi:hypothetical protein
LVPPRKAVSSCRVLRYFKGVPQKGRLMDTSLQTSADMVEEAEYVIRVIEQHLFPAYRQEASESACVDLAATMREHKKVLKQEGMTPVRASEALAAVSHLYFNVLKDLEMHGKILQVTSI